MVRFTDIDDLDIHVQKDDLVRIASNLIQATVTRDKIEAEFSIKVRPDESIFAALVRESIAQNVFDATAIIGKRFRPEGGGSWNELSKWVAEYEAHENRRSGR